VYPSVEQMRSDQGERERGVFFWYPCAWRRTLNQFLKESGLQIIRNVDKVQNDIFKQGWTNSAYNDGTRYRSRLSAFPLSPHATCDLQNAWILYVGMFRSVHWRLTPEALVPSPLQFYPRSVTTAAALLVTFSGLLLRHLISCSKNIKPRTYWGRRYLDPEREGK
jgi:hypothetical protein